MSLAARWIAAVSSSPSFGTAPYDVIEVQPAGWLAGGAFSDLVGRYPGSGFREPRYLVELSDHRMVQLSRLLFVVAANLDGGHSVEEVADRVSAQYRRRLTPEGLEFLVEAKLRPLGLIDDDRSSAAPAQAASTRPVGASPSRGSILASTSRPISPTRRCRSRICTGRAQCGLWAPAASSRYAGTGMWN